MEVLAITNTPGVVKGDNSAKSMGFGRRSESNDAVAYQIAVERSVAQSNNRQKNIKRLVYSVPLLAGISTAILHKGNSKVLDKEISGLAGKLSEGVKAGGSWAGLLGLGVVIGAADAAIAKKSDNFRNFRHNHPFLSFVGDMGVFLAAAAAIPAGFNKLVAKIKPQHLEKMSRGIQNVAEHVNRIKTPQFIKNLGTKISNVVPDAVKNLSVPNFVKKSGEFVKGVGKSLLAFAPHIALLTAIFESVSGRARVESDFVRNYSEVKREMEEV